MEDRSLRDEWLQMPFTEHLQRAAEAAEKLMLERLITTCRTSTDATIVKSYSQYEYHQRLTKLMKSGEVAS